MRDYEEGDIDEDFFSSVQKMRKTAKEDLLDETYKKAEKSKEFRSKSGKKVPKKPFLKLGLVLIFIAVFSLVVINFMPWMFVKYNTEYETMQESHSLEDFKNSDELFYRETRYIFESPCTNCSNNSKNFIGLTIDDFTGIASTVSYAFYSLIILGAVFTTFEIFRKKRDTDADIVTLMQSMFATAACVIGVFTALLLIKFLGPYFLLYYNRPFIEASGINTLVIIFPAALILIIISFVIIMITTSVMRINFHEFEKRLTSNKTRSALSDFKFGSLK